MGYFGLFLLQSVFCVPVTAGIGLLVGFIIGKLNENPQLRLKGLGIGAIVGVAISIFFTIALPCGFFGC